MEFYHVEIQVSPAKESHEIGSQVTLNCMVTPSPQKYGNFTLPSYQIRYRWYTTSRGSLPLTFGRLKSITITIASYQQSVGEYYCLIYRKGYLLGKGKTTLTVEGMHIK